MASTTFAIRPMVGPETASGYPGEQLPSDQDRLPIHVHWSALLEPTSYGARGFRDDVAKRFKAELGGKSVRFQDSQQGDEAAEFCDQWENLDLDNPYLDVEHARRLESVPVELK